MRTYMNHPHSDSALLRSGDSVDTPETNSLCCEAAGIIASSSATAEAHIPHEKLRGAAHVDATLNAQERPLAQPAVGYTRFSDPVFCPPEAKPGRRYWPADPTCGRPEEWAVMPPKHVRDALTEAYQQDQAKISGGDA